jgi:hypothetical protein
MFIHLSAFAIGAYFAWRSFGGGMPLLGWAFTLFAAAEISYLTYHLDWTVFLFAHTISEVLDLLAFILVFVAATRTGHGRAPQRRGPRLMRRRLTPIAVPLLGIVILLAACAPAGGGRARRHRPRGPAAVLPVRAGGDHGPDGTTVTWTNSDNFTHNVRLLDDGGQELTLAPGESVSFTFTGSG